jgi:pimeloyl-ACP methyl ester carboxylesterase
MFSFGDVEIEVEVKGDGELIVLLPWHGGDFDYLAPFASMLAEAGFRTAAINPRGIGRSKGPLENLTLHDFAGDVANVIATLDAAPAHVLGHAHGNRVARCVAADHPDLVRTVILLAAGGKVPPDPEMATVRKKITQADSLEEERLEAFRQLTFSPNTDIEVVKGHQISRKRWPETSAAQARAGQATPLEAWWTAGVAPMLVIQGLDDRTAPPGNGRALRDELGDRVKLVELPDAGHALIIEQPEVIARAVIEYLKE